MRTASAKVTDRVASSPKPPAWLIVITAGLTFTCLGLAVAETNLWAHYLIDGGEYLSLFGLTLILIAGLYLFKTSRLFVSLPLVFPWLLYPIITQGDQIIDNLSIGAMRVVCHLLLAAIFGTPVLVLVVGARVAFAPKNDPPRKLSGWIRLVPGLRLISEGRARRGTGLLATTLLIAEIWIAEKFLGRLMVGTLLLLALAALLYAILVPPASSHGIMNLATRERFALAILLAGTALSSALYLGFKNRPGAYQGSPSAFMDPNQKTHAYPLTRLPVPHKDPTAPTKPLVVKEALTSYAHAFEQLLVGYHILDRNYTYDFHNHLFLRNTPLLPEYRHAGLAAVSEACRLGGLAETEGKAAEATMAIDDPLFALLQELHSYLDYNFGRGPKLEQLSGQFELTPAGLQHAAHLYEGESKALGNGLIAILKKHHAVLESPLTRPVTREFQDISRSVYQAYAHHVVGF